MHGWAISERIQQISEDVLQVNQGSLYPALHRLEQKKWLRSEWRASETGREAKFYALHALSLLTGILGAATVIGAFLTGWPSLIAVILNYVKRGDARGTWLESHFRWQIRTFWFGLLWVSLCILFIVVTLGLGALIAWILLVGVGLWFIYRIVRGWLALSGRRPMYA